MSYYSHPKCYANKIGNCSTKISREHIISNNILEIFEHDKAVKITGLPWFENKTFNLISRKSLVSNVLCTEHNSVLSNYDTEAGKFFRCIKEFDSDFNKTNPKNECISLNGHYIEKWMLKMACTLIASNQIAENGEKKHIIMKDSYIDILFNDAEWEKGWGLYFKIDNQQVHKYDCVSFLPMTHNDELLAAEFLINNFKFYLLLGRPENPEAFGLHRINELHFTDSKAKKTIVFEWNDKKYNQCIELMRQGTTTESPTEWEEYLKK